MRIKFKKQPTLKKIIQEELQRVLFENLGSDNLDDDGSGEIGVSNFSKPLAKVGLLLGKIEYWYTYGGDRREREEKPLTIGMDDFDSILSPYFNKWITISLDDNQFCGQLDSFDVEPGVYPKLKLNFKNVGYVVDDNKEEYMDETIVTIKPLTYKGGCSVSPSLYIEDWWRSNIKIEMNGDSNADLIVSDQPSFKFMEELGPNPSVNAGIRFLRDWVTGDGYSEDRVIPPGEYDTHPEDRFIHPIQILGIKSIFPREKTDIILDVLEEYIERGDLIIEPTGAK